MKKIFKVIGVSLLMVTFSQTAKAQFNAGLELAMPLGSFGTAASFGAGATLGYDYAANDNLSIVLQAGYIKIFEKAPDVTLAVGESYSTSIGLIPIQAGVKYYFADNTNGFYGLALAGVHIYKYTSDHTYLQNEYNFNVTPYTVKEVEKTDNFDYSGTFVSYAVGAGYLINEKIDLSVRYNIISSTGGSSAYLGLRAAYNF